MANARVFLFRMCFKFSIDIKHLSNLHALSFLASKYVNKEELKYLQKGPISKLKSQWNVEVLATFGRKTARSYLGGAIRGTPTWLASIMLITLTTPYNSLDNTSIMHCIMHTVTSLWHLLLSPYDWHPTPRTRRVLPILIPRCSRYVHFLKSDAQFKVS